MQYKDMASLSDEGLVHAELAAERELLAATFRLRMGNLEDTSTIGKLRKKIARLRTAQRERERAQGLATDSLRNRFSASFAPSVAPGPSAGSSGSFVKGLVDKVGVSE